MGGGLLPGRSPEPKQGTPPLGIGRRCHIEGAIIDRLVKLLEPHDQSTRGPWDRGMDGVLADGAELLKGEFDQGVRDAG
jgi:hypothetical protein